jgi:rsbT co-antagonist protein RsbR
VKPAVACSLSIKETLDPKGTDARSGIQGARVSEAESGFLDGGTLMKQSGTTPPDSWESAYLYSTEALFIANADGTLSHWSEPFGQLVGHAVAQGTPLSQLFHEDDREPFAATWARLRETTGPLELHGRVLTAEGVYASLSCLLREAPLGRVVYGSLRQPHGTVHSVANDMNGIAESAEMLRVLCRNLPVVVWAIDRDGMFTYCDGLALERMGMDQVQFIGRYVFDIFPDTEDGSNDIRRALRGLAAHNQSRNQNMFWENWVVPLKDSHANVHSVVGLTLDISEQKKAEEELRVRLQQIERQQDVIGKLSTPIIQVWEGVVALPMIGVVDSQRTADVMQALLDEIVRTGAHYAILDLTGVEMVDTQVANHMIKLVNAIRLLGAGGIICGIRPTVAQIIVDLGLDLTTIVTRANLKAGLMFCIDQMRRLQTAGQPLAR